MADDSAVVVFNPDEFREQRPVFSDLTDATLGYYFSQAELFCYATDFENVEGSSVSYDLRKAILYALVCHLATLEERGTGVTGSIASATEGSVSVSYNNGMSSSGNESADWLNQTQCGSYAWTLMRKLTPMTPRLYCGRRWHR